MMLRSASMSTREIEVGIRIGAEGMAYFGLEQVNRELAAGAKIVELRPGGVVMDKVGEDADNVRLTLAGCQIVVVLHGAG